MKTWILINTIYMILEIITDDDDDDDDDDNNNEAVKII